MHVHDLFSNVHFKIILTSLKLAFLTDFFTPIIGDFLLLLRLILGNNESEKKKKINHVRACQKVGNHFDIVLIVQIAPPRSENQSFYNLTYCLNRAKAFLTEKRVFYVLLYQKSLVQLCLNLLKSINKKIMKRIFFSFNDTILMD